MLSYKPIHAYARNENSLKVYLHSTKTIFESLLSNFQRQSRNGHIIQANLCKAGQARQYLRGPGKVGKPNITTGVKLSKYLKSGLELQSSSDNERQNIIF